MKEFFIKICSVITVIFTIFLIGKSQGKKDKENEIIKNNENKKKEYEKNKFNNINDVVKFLHKK